MAVVRDAGATFLGPVQADLAGLVCLSGDLGSHLAIVSRGSGTPALVGVQIAEGQTLREGMLVELDLQSGQLRPWTPEAVSPASHVLSAAEIDEWRHNILTRISGYRPGTRTMFASPLIPMEYLAIQGLEVWDRWPAIVDRITTEWSPEAIGAGLRRPGLGVNSTHFFCLACLPPGGHDGWLRHGVSYPDTGRRLLHPVRVLARRHGASWRAPTGSRPRGPPATSSSRTPKRASPSWRRRRSACRRPR